MPKKLSSKYNKDKGEAKESRQDYKAWKNAPSQVGSRDRSITISPKERKVSRISKSKHDKINEKTAERLSRYNVNKNRRVGERKTLLEAKQPRVGSGLARSGIIRRKNQDQIKRLENRIQEIKIELYKSGQ